MNLPRIALAVTLATATSACTVNVTAPISGTINAQGSTINAAPAVATQDAIVAVAVAQPTGPAILSLFLGVLNGTDHIVAVVTVTNKGTGMGSGSVIVQALSHGILSGDPASATFSVSPGESLTLDRFLFGGGADGATASISANL